MLFENRFATHDVDGVNANADIYMCGTLSEIALPNPEMNFIPSVATSVRLASILYMSEISSFPTLSDGREEALTALHIATRRRHSQATLKRFV